MFFLVMSCPIVAGAQTQKEKKSSYVWLEGQVATERPGETAKWARGEHFFTLSFGKEWSKWLGLTAQVGHGNKWGETTLGPSFALTPELSVSAGVGVEHFGDYEKRFRANLYYDHERSGSFVYFSYDKGKSGQWVWLDATHIWNKGGIGLLIQMPGGGVGPKIEFRTNHYALWTALLFDQGAETHRVMLGGRLKWEK